MKRGSQSCPNMGTVPRTETVQRKGNSLDIREIQNPQPPN